MFFHVFSHVLVVFSDVKKPSQKVGVPRGVTRLGFVWLQELAQMNFRGTSTTLALSLPSAG